MSSVEVFSKDKTWKKILPFRKGFVAVPSTLYYKVYHIRQFVGLISYTNLTDRLKTNVLHMTCYIIIYFIKQTL